MDPPLPPGWSAARDPASGRTYYYEHSTRRTAWSRPAPAASEEAEELPPGVERSAGPAALPRPAPASSAAAAPRAAAPHTVARPDAAAEPVAETRAAAPTRKHRLNTACTFVIAPGASGANFCYELTECLRRLGHATEVERWHGAYSKDIKRNADRLERFAKEAAAASGEGCRVLLVGDGYGGRVVAHLLARWAAGEPPPANVFADAALLVGYQLYGAAPPRNSGDDRLALLQALPASTRLLFVSGEKDEFLDRTKGGTAWRDVGAARGVAALRAAAADLPCAAHATVVGIENTGQQPLRAGRKRTEPAKALVLRALAPFVDALAGVVDDDRRLKRLRADPDDALARADDDEAADGLTRAHDLEAVAEGEKRGAYGYN
ncbi:unnamed protein product [Pelagomonas calceolata]|uniref:WW domain-containing protein n=2 Tax=Pelagomonas calceolata TaxID=35677 RepID=A0A8J2SZ26_9STRA|nr:unnamed protein product [Pelagomonas calceolata]